MIFLWLIIKSITIFMMILKLVKTLIELAYLPKNRKLELESKKLDNKSKKLDNKLKKLKYQKKRSVNILHKNVGID